MKKPVVAQEVDHEGDSGNSRSNGRGRSGDNEGPGSTDKRRPKSRGGNLKKKVRNGDPEDGKPSSRDPEERKPSPRDPKEGKPSPPRVCRFYVTNSRCKYGDKCRYVHPEMLLNTKERRGVGDTQKVLCADDASAKLASQEDSQHSKQQVEGIMGRSGGEDAHKPLPRQTPVKTTPQDTREGHSEPQQLVKARERKDMQERHAPTKALTNATPQAYSKDSHGPPPLTLASFIGGRTHVQRPQRSGRSKELSSNSLREVSIN